MSFPVKYKVTSNKFSFFEAKQKLHDGSICSEATSGWVVIAIEYSWFVWEKNFQWQDRFRENLSSSILGQIHLETNLSRTNQILNVLKSQRITIESKNTTIYYATDCHFSFRKTVKKIHWKTRGKNRWSVTYFHHTFLPFLHLTLETIFSTPKNLISSKVSDLQKNFLICTTFRISIHRSQHISYNTYSFLSQHNTLSSYILPLF